MEKGTNLSKKSHSYTQFGGILTYEDFNTYTPNRNRIKNQMDAIHFGCELKNQKKKTEKYKNTTLEDLRRMRLISNTDGRPSGSLTNAMWQKELSIRKLFIAPYKDGQTKKLCGRLAEETGSCHEQSQSRYDGCTTWQTYCTFINDVLKNIRAGQIDYCYYMYQILDLLKFHYEDLRTRYRDGYWEVWLEHTHD